MTANEEWFVVRPRFWPLWFRVAVVLQLLLLLVYVCFFAFRGLHGRTLFGWDDAIQVSMGCTVVAVSSVGFACAIRWTNRVVILPYGVQMHWQNGWVGKFYRWARLVRVTPWGWGVVSGRWLKVWPDTGPAFVLPVHSQHLAELCDAVERFAGPDHPLAVALSEVEERA